MEAESLTKFLERRAPSENNSKLQKKVREGQK